MKGEISLKILESIKDFVVNTADLFEIIAGSGHYVSYGRIQYELSSRQRERQKEEFNQEERRRLKQKYSKMIFSLKRDNLIEEKQKDNKKFLVLTVKGKNKLILLKERNKKRLPEISYKKETANRIIMVIFDIPETEKRKRNWLRAVLKNLNFQMIQKSVWVGKLKIPKEFLDDLYKLKLIDFVEILEINKSGSLKHLI